MHQIALRAGTELLGPAQEADVFAGRAQLAAPRLRDWEQPLFEQTMPHVPVPEPVELDRLLLPGDELDWEFGAELIGAPGHTPGQLAVWIPEHRTLIAADALATRDGQPVVGAFNIDPEQAARTALRLLELEPTRLCVGHGAPLSGEIRSRFAQAG